MVALSPAERKKVGKAKAYYKDSIKNQGGENAVFEQLKSDLKQRYLNNPAIITLKQADGTEIDISLPFEWQEFQRFKQQHNLTESQYQAALEAYYKHEAHTAYRYLSKPNHWMASNASFVYVLRDENGMVTSHRYSTFEDYKPLIVLFYTAVCDETATAIDGHTHEGRVELFIKQLALIGRAHNWDDSRAKLDEDGNQQFDANGYLITEEYDNLQGDKPSCYSGVKRRLFQSVLGHGLFKVLTADIVKQTVREQLRLYFNTKITKENAKALKEAYDGICCFDDDIETHLNTLRALDMDDSERHKIFTRVGEQLDNAFLGQFSDNKIQFESVINRYLGSKDQPDIMTYGDSLSLWDVVKQRINESNHANVANVGMFGSSSSAPLPPSCQESISRKSIPFL